MEVNSPKLIWMNWENRNYDVLVKIFSTFHVLDLVLSFSRVSRSWELACSDPSLWKTLDLTALGNYFLIPQRSDAWSDEDSSNLMRYILTSAFNLSRGNTTRLIFHFYAAIDDEHLCLAAERCPRLKQLVLSPSRRLTQRGFLRALTAWSSCLESLIIPFISASNLRVVNLIGGNCRILKELKFACHLTMEMATCLTTFSTNLKVLSLRGSIIYKDALEFLLENIPSLEVLNITHSLVIYNPQQPSGNILIFPDINDSIMQKASRLSEFYTCDKLSCDSCQQKYSEAINVRAEVEGNWYHEFGEDFWRADEIKSLAY